jgi:glycosyltransferase involved in cell wall biosynthesis
MSRPELLVVTNLPSPYRVHELRVLGRHLEQRGVGLSVRFMATTERGRHWTYSPEDLGFRGRVAWGTTVYPRGDHIPLHLNPGLILETLTGRSRWVLLGGAWYQPPVSAALTLRGRPRRHLLFWNESVVGATSGAPVEGARRLIFSRCDGFVVPGSRAEAHIRRYSRRPVLRLPNFVDEHLYRDRVAELRADGPALRRRWDIREDSPVFAWPARLHPAKGILPFLRAVRSVPRHHVIAIAGEGPQRREIEDFLTREKTTNVRLLGHLDGDDLLALYAIADALLLPSSFEPFGFVAVEALWAGLPIIVSSKAGAAPETVVHGVNGWIVDPDDADDVAESFAQAVGLGQQGLASMGRRSLELATERFDSNRAAGAFVGLLLEQFPP